MKINTAVLTFLICFMVTTSVNADILAQPNGDFEGGTFVGRGGNIMPVEWDNANNIIDGGWGNPTVDAGYDSNGSNGFVVTNIDGSNPTSGGYSVVFQIGNMPLATLGIPEQTYITFSADINDLVPGGSGPGAILKVEYFRANGTEISEEEIAVTDANAYVGWTNHSRDFTIPATTVAIKFVFGVSTGWGGPVDGPSSFAFDNLKVGVLGGTPALMPVPVVEGALDPNNAVISWINPEGTISADVYLCESDVNYSYPLYPWPRSCTLIANDTTLESLNISVQPNKYYYWAVDVTTGSGEVPGYTWKFQTFDSPVSDVNAGADQYLWLVGGTKTFTLNGSYTDDGKSPVTKTWTNTTAPGDTDPGTSVVIANPNSLTTNVTVNNTGWFEFTLTVTDGVSSKSDSVHVGVYANACAAANADPGDIAASYPNGHGDIDGDCDTDYYDFATLAGSWLECMSPKLGCTP